MIRAGGRVWAHLRDSGDKSGTDSANSTGALRLAALPPPLRPRHSIRRLRFRYVSSIRLENCPRS